MGGWGEEGVRREGEWRGWERGEEKQERGTRERGGQGKGSGSESGRGRGGGEGGGRGEKRKG